MSYFSHELELCYVIMNYLTKLALYRVVMTQELGSGGIKHTKHTVWPARPTADMHSVKLLRGTPLDLTSYSATSLL